MKVYIVYTHPNPGSFNHGLLESLSAGLTEAGHEVTVSDLYADGFKAELDAKELAGLADGKVSDDVRAYQEKILAADAMAFIFPIWWFGPPALLKGWFDRVLSRGFAYDFGPAGLMPKLKVKKALVLATAGGMEKMYTDLGFTNAINKTLVNGTLQFCGIYNIKFRIFHDCLNCNDQFRQDFLAEARKLGATFFR
jgi:NAD(P)H dehydrogenase (quinone)